MKTKIKSNISRIGWYQTIGGSIGVLMTLLPLTDTDRLTGLNSLPYVFSLLLFGYSIYCGVLCFKLKENALWHSQLNQFLQLFGFALFGYAFNYASGLFLTIGVDLSESFEMKFGAGVSKFDFNINREQNRAEIDFNLVAFALIYWLDKLRKRIKEENQNLEIASIGQG